MTPLNIVFLDRATIPAHLTIPKPDFAHNWVEFDLTAPDQVAERIRTADIVISNKVVLNRDNLQAAPEVKLIAVSATGVNNVDIDYCREQGIAVCNIRGYATQSVPEHTMAMLFALKHNLRGYHQDIANGEWQKQGQFCFFTHPISDIAGSTLGIIGGGELGQATARLARAVGMQVVFAERKGVTRCRPGYLKFTQLLATADAVSLHCPLNEETRNLIGSAELAMMKPGAVLINTGRGGLVDEQALVAALKSGRLAGAASDVFTQEPADKSNPLLANVQLPNLILTPHVAWGSESAINKLLAILIENIEAFVRGEEKNRVV